VSEPKLVGLVTALSFARWSFCERVFARERLCELDFERVDREVILMRRLLSKT
jgi:hypothetical protein